MKRIFTLLVISLGFIFNAIAQKGPVNNPLGGSLPTISSTSVITCGILTLTITATDPTCNGAADGTATVQVSGGVQPYTYLWTPTNATTSTITGLVGNTYIVEVWDATNTVAGYCSGSISLVNPASLIVNITPPTPVTNCFGSCDGSATASGTGGTSPYTYSWNTVPVQTTGLATGLCAQVYVVTATDANNCTRVKNVSIGQPALLVANGSNTSITCFGACNGTASVAPTGGNVPYTYSWNTGATTSAISGRCPGTYSCSIVDAKGCTDIYSTTITEPSILDVALSGNNLVCNSVCTGSVSATASGGMGTYTYSWASGGYTSSAVTGLCAGTYTLSLRDANSCLKTQTITLTQPSALTSVPTGTNINCNNICDGTASANAAGGTAPYTYLWNSGGLTTSAVTGLCALTYTLDITDANGCTVQKNITLTQPAVLAVNPSTSGVSCPTSCNGTATAATTGGTTPYTYAWSPSGCTTSACAGLCANTYSILVTDVKGCTATSTVTVSPPPAILTNVSSTPALCFGNSNGTVSSNTSGGVPPYTYSWSSGCTTSACSGLAAGNYTLTVTDNNGCIVSSTVSITQPAPFVASIASASPNPLNCNGDCDGTGLASVSGGTATYSYLWTNGSTTIDATGLCAGGYTVTATDSHGCTAKANVTFTAPSMLSVSLSVTNVSCSFGANGSIAATATGGNGGYTYAWQPGGQTTSAISSLPAGNYTVNVTDSKGCSNTQTVAVTAPSSVAANASVVNNVLCSGNCDGTAVANPSGGTGAYTYLWSGGTTTSTKTGLCQGSVSVLVQDANGCSDLDILNITQPSNLLSFVWSATSGCGSCSGSASVMSVGGTAPYTYSWSPSGQITSTATGLCVGGYTATISDANGCTNTVTLAITSQITVAMSSSGPKVTCPGSCDAAATATPAGGGTPYTYSWNSTPVQTTQSATGLCAGGYTVTVTDATGCTATKTVSFSSPPTFTTSVSSTGASCGVCNGSATVAAAGGTGALTYSWSGFPVQNTATATGLCAGDYTVTTTDANGCTATNTVTIAGVPTITNSAATTLSTCGGTDGAICVTPSGGAPAYTYAWLPGGATGSCIAGIAAGVYTVTISDAGGCAVPFPIALGNLGGPTVTVTSSVSPTCNAGCDGSIDISAAGSNPPFNYLWNPGGQTSTSIAALCAGTYVVQVTDAAPTPCIGVASVTLNTPPQIIGNPTITNVSCAGGSDGSICMSPANGTAPYTYQWLPGGETTSCRTALSAGSYSVVISDANGCDDTLLIPVSVPSTLSLTLTSSNVTCNGSANGTATAVVGGGTTPYTYSWSTSSGLPGIVALAPGTYSVLVTDKNGCTATASVSITEPAALTNSISSTSANCNLVCDGTAAITGSGGTTAYTYLWSPGGETTSAITGLCQGNYAVTLSDANGCTSTSTVAISQPSAISVTVTPTNASCFGGCDGTASATATGGTGAFTYTWNPGTLTGASVTGLCVSAYTLTTSDANGCTITSAFSISAPAVLQANISTTITACTSSCDGVANSAPVGGTGAYTFLWSNGQTTATATGLCAGAHTLTLSDANGCSIVQTANVGSPTPFSQSSAISGATCNLCNGTITVVGTGGTTPYSYFWSTGVTTGTITGLCAGVYIDTVMDANGCISIDTLALNNTTGPTITVGSTSVTCNGACDGTGTVLTAIGDGAPWIYNWTFPPGSQTTQSVTGLCPGQYFVGVTDTIGCVTILPINIVEPAALSPNAVATNATCFGICDGSIVSKATGGIGAYTYSWMPGGQTTSAISAQCAGTYTLTLKDANNCSATATITVGQNTVLSSTVTSTNNSCNGSCNGTASISISGGTSPYTYTWTGGQTISTATGLCAGSYTVNVNDAIGCQTSGTVMITEPAAITASVTTINPLCNAACNGSITITPSGGTSPYTYLWMPGNLTTSAISGLCANTYTLILSDANTCSSTTTVTLTDPAVLAATATVTNASCSNSCDGSIDIAPSGGTTPYTFTWAPGAQTSEDATGLCTGNYSVTIADSNSCTVTYTVTIGATTTILAMASNDTSFCVGGSTTLVSTSVNASSIGWYQLPAWTLIGSTQTVSVTPSVGVNTYALIASNGACSDTDSVVVTVNNYPVVVVNDTTVCVGSTTTICASGATNYQWFQLPAWTAVATGMCVSVSPPLGITNYAIVGMNGLCSDTDSVAVTVLTPPIADAGVDTAICQGGSVSLCGTLSQNGVTFNWFVLPAWTPGDTDTCTTVSPFVTTDYALIVSNGACSDTDTVNVLIYPAPVANAGSDVTVLASANTVLSGTGGGTYLWSPAAGLSSTSIANPTANPTVTTTYSLIVTDASGCTSIDSLKITVVTQVIPNDGLSPNGDGINDVWVIPNIEQFPNALVEVYNRWGELLFHSIGYSEKWDAKYKGKDLPVGTYYYVINLNSDLYPDPMAGPITILR